EGIICAPETDHAVRVTIDEALKCKETGEAKTILCGLSGHGHVDMAAYAAYLSGKLEDYEYPEAKIKAALAHLPLNGK
ncbi:TrpB-like pyridoxal-phosphate dependent enzyme, partial [bacterium]|nr:TrpB-like pyridoxal-phosphate dependent enzyme [bacterium]